jgi:hypothetical protein
MLELVALGTDLDAAEAAASATGGDLYLNHPDESPKRPYSTMVRAATDQIETIRSAADVALYVCFARVIKPMAPNPSPDRAIAAFVMVGNPDLSHRESDDHWRDVHAPLALRCHTAMCDYTQLSVVATLPGRGFGAPVDGSKPGQGFGAPVDGSKPGQGFGAPVDGIALCAFDTRQDLSERFFNDDEAKAAIVADVAHFADPARSPRRVVLNQIHASSVDR